MADHYSDQRDWFDEQAEMYHTWCRKMRDEEGYGYRDINKLEKEGSPITKKWSWWIRRGWN